MPHAAASPTSPTRATACLQPPVLCRSGFRQRLKRGREAPHAGTHAKRGVHWRFTHQDLASREGIS
jgi:hypothetical protein